MQKHKSINIQISTTDKKTTQIVIVCVHIYIKLLIDRGWSDHVNSIKYSINSEWHGQIAMVQPNKMVQSTANSSECIVNAESKRMQSKSVPI